jgi:hypothetical protein
VTLAVDGSKPTVVHPSIHSASLRHRLALEVPFGKRDLPNGRSAADVCTTYQLTDALYGDPMETNSLLACAHFAGYHQFVLMHPLEEIDDRSLLARISAAVVAH